VVARSKCRQEGRLALLDLDEKQFTSFFESLGQPAYRARQVWHWIYRRHVLDFADMTNLPSGLRQDLVARAFLPLLRVLDEKKAADGLTDKLLFGLPDGKSVEAVLMRYDGGEKSRRRRTVCVSTQVGCPIGCAFCATGRQGFVRNLSSGEILAQVLYFSARGLVSDDGPVTNVVFMGQGEPLLNFPAVWHAIEVLNSSEGFDLGARHITISTAGVVPRIRELAKKGLQVGLAISLHAPTDELRTRLVPLNRRYPLAILMAACREYVAITGRRVTFEYAMIDRINDDLVHARQLAGLLKGLSCHVNLIPLNPTEAETWHPSPHNRVLAFQAELETGQIRSTLRVKRGGDILAACGQLRSRCT